jgi:hypothetical protein
MESARIAHFRHDLVMEVAANGLPWMKSRADGDADIKDQGHVR